MSRIGVDRICTMRSSVLRSRHAGGESLGTRGGPVGWDSRRPRGLVQAMAGIAFGLILGAGPALAQIDVGEIAPDFTKDRLGGGTVALSDYSGQVVVLFLLGYG